MSRRLLLTAAATLAASLGSAASASAAPYSVLQLNICGSGLAPCFNRMTPDKAGEAAKEINLRKPSAVTVNEMCLNDLARIRSLTGGYNGSFMQAGSQRCKNGQPYGVGVLFSPGTTRGKIFRSTYADQQAGAERRVLLCQDGGGVRLCTTHLDSKGKQGLQAKEMKKRLQASVNAGVRVVLGGDWNLKYGGTPDAQSFVPTGMFRKGDAVQHIMATQRHFTYKSARRTYLFWTDHSSFLVKYDVR